MGHVLKLKEYTDMFLITYYDVLSFLCYRGAARGVLYKKLFLKILQCVGVSF